MSSFQMNVMLCFFIFTCLVIMVATNLYYIVKAFRNDIGIGLACTMNACAGAIIYSMFVVFQTDILTILSGFSGLGHEIPETLSKTIFASTIGALTGLFYGAHFSNNKNKRFSWSLIPLTIIQFALVNVVVNIYSSDLSQLSKDIVPPCLFVLSLTLAFVFRFTSTGGKVK